MSMTEKKLSETPFLEREFFQCVWDHSEDNLFVVLKDAHGDFITDGTNPALAKTFNIPEPFLKNYPLKKILPNEMYQSVCSRYQACLDSGESITYEESFIIDESGQPRYWQTRILPVVDSKTGEERIFGISREITQLKQMSTALEKANQNLEKKVAERTLALEKALEEVQQISITDKLTGLYNRHKLDEVLSENLNLAKRYSSTFGVILIDIDDFKAINDSLGHLVGDSLLIHLAKVLFRSLRKTDYIGRWGGDEFMVIVPQTAEKEIHHVAQALQNNVRQYNFVAEQALCISMGATKSKEGDDIKSIIRRADDGLYQAKNQGKDSIGFKY